MGKPQIGNKLPILTIEKYRKTLERNGFVPDEERHNHIQYKNKDGIKITVMKGRKDINPYLLKQIIKELAEKLNKPQNEIINMICEYKKKK